MKVLILAGGMGTRLSEETSVRPKPMAEIGGRPILWHIMKIYGHYGFNDFVILLGYKGYVIKEFFANYFLHQSDVTIDLSTNSLKVLNNSSEPWRVTLLDTGEATMTGGRVLRARPVVGDEPFLLTYGDGVADIDLTALVEFHRRHGRTLTMTAVQPEGRFGVIRSDASDRVLEFAEKPSGDGSWFNAGFFVCEPGLFRYLENDETVLERRPLERLAADGELYTYRHRGFWRCMDTLRDKTHLGELWDSGKPQWRVWGS